MHAMRMGPGKHLQGRILMNGLVKPEEFDYFHEVNLSELSIFKNVIYAFTLAYYNPRICPV
jgi:hypothetical protein